jgi:phenylacetic acid degradation operon negative regulatory protein
MKEASLTASVPAGAAAAPRIGPGSARSVLLTLFGEFVHPSREPTWTSTLLYAFAGVGIAEKAARQALARAATAGWIESDRNGRRAAWRPTERVTQLITEGSRRVRSIRDANAAWKGEWLVLYITLPESRRADRLRLYRALSWLGFGSPRPGLWIGPHAQRAEAARTTVEQLDLAANTVAFSAQSLQFGVSERELVAQAWDLDALSLHYEVLVQHFRELRPRSEEDVFFAHIELVNALQRLPSIDPGLPAALLPADWQGARAGERLDELRAKWRATAHTHWRQVQGENG